MTAATAAKPEANDSQPRTLVDSAFETAHKAALAGVGVAGEVADAGARIFDRLVQRGEKVESRGRESLSDWRDKAEAKVQKARSAAERGFEQARAGIDERLERRLEQLGVPGKADFEAVVERLSAIEARLEALEATPEPRQRAAAETAPARAE